MVAVAPTLWVVYADFLMEDWVLAVRFGLKLGSKEGEGAEEEGDGCSTLGNINKA
jgi:hypothetical protein